MPIAVGPRPPGARQLGLHVLLLQRLDRLPVEPQLLGHVADAPLLPIIMASHTRFLTVPFAQVRGDHRPEMDDPAPDGLVRDRNAAFCQQVFDVAQA
jgi:hypothetical protein